MHVAGPTSIAFVTSVYGDSYLSFLGPHIYSLARCYTKPRGVVLWDKIPESGLRLLRPLSSTYTFLNGRESVTGDANQKISRKLHYWAYACKLLPDGPLCLLDCDTLVVKPIDSFFAPEFDVLFTWKEGRWPLNTGVMLLKNSPAVRCFMNEWKSRVEDIVTHPEALSEALRLSGAADQHALGQLIGFGPYEEPIVRRIGDHDMLFKGVPCRFLNEVNCVPITEDTHIIHYKAGWHRILIAGEPFSSHRPQQKCQEMYDLWFNAAADANAAVARNVVTHAARKCLDRFQRVTDTYEERGILHSEMLAVCAVCDYLDVDVIIESGRCRGQSTLVLARYFQDRRTKIISIELERDENAPFAERRLAPYSNVQLLYGDSTKMMPALIENLKGKRIAILLDGPKGQAAFELLRRLLREPGDIVAAFFHDTRKGVPVRRIAQDGFARVFFTDDDEYVQAYSELDAPCHPTPGQAITTHTWRPYMKGHDRIGSYGPTLAVVFPLPEERLGKGNRQATKPRGLVELLKTFCHVVVHEGPRPALRRAFKRIPEKVGLRTS